MQSQEGSVLNTIASLQEPNLSSMAQTLPLTTSSTTVCRDCPVTVVSTEAALAPSGAELQEGEARLGLSSFK